MPIVNFARLFETKCLASKSRFKLKCLFKVFLARKCKLYWCGVSILLEVVKKRDLGDWVSLHKNRGAGGKLLFN